MAGRAPDPAVLIAGAGPTGLTLALWLTNLGIRARIIDKNAEPAAYSRALGVQAGTLEFYRQLGDLADEVVERGVKVAGINLWSKGRKAARVPFEDAGAGLSPFPFVLTFAQDAHERLLIDRLARLERSGKGGGAGCGVVPIRISFPSGTSMPPARRSIATSMPTSTRPISSRFFRCLARTGFGWSAPFRTMRSKTRMHLDTRT